MSVSKIPRIPQTKSSQENLPIPTSRKALFASNPAHIVIPKLKGRATPSFTDVNSSKKAKKVKDSSNVFPKTTPISPVDKPHTIGVVIFADGTKYKGELYDKIPNGLGILTFANENKYQGEFNQGRMQGIGIFHFGNGDLYRGSFEQDLFHGLGRYIFADGRHDLEGMFSNGTFLS
ncbi:MAG TPA: hypothetical protein VIJ14_03310 [Rhabdochlamydiaceae bacterium]